MQTHRFYLAPESCRGNVLQLEGGEAHHASHVLRLRKGDEVVALDGAGTEYFCTVENCSRDAVSLRVIRKQSAPPPPCSTTLLVGIPRGKIIEAVIQKSVELG